MVEKVTDPQKIVTDKLVLKRLAEQGIDKDYVEFWHDYAPRSKGKEYSPYAKFYRDLKSNKKIMVVSGLPKVKPDGQKIEVGWIKQGNKYVSKPNLFSAIVNGRQITVTCLSDQPSGTKKNDKATWQPQLFYKGAEISPIPEEATLLDTDPTNENYHQNVLEWDYGICKRRVRIIEGRLSDRWHFTTNPQGEVRIKHNNLGKLLLGLGQGVRVSVEDDTEVVSAGAFREAIYPVIIGASPETLYSTADTYMSSINNTTNYGTSDWLYVGDGASGETHNLRSLGKVDLSSISASAIITAVTLSLYEADASDTAGVGSWAVELNRLLLNWVEAQATWEIYSTGNSWNTAGAAGSDSDIDSDISATLTLDGTAAGGYVDWTGATLTEDVQKIVDGTYANNYGWRIAAPNAEGQGAGGLSYNGFHSLDKGTGYKPKLVVTYHFEQATGGGSVAIAGTLGIKVKTSPGGGSVAIAGSLGRNIFVSVGAGAVSIAGTLSPIKRFIQAVGGGSVAIASILGWKKIKQALRLAPYSYSERKIEEEGEE